MQRTFVPNFFRADASVFRAGRAGMVTEHLMVNFMDLLCFIF